MPTTYHVVCGLVQHSKCRRLSHHTLPGWFTSSKLFWLDPSLNPSMHVYVIVVKRQLVDLHFSYTATYAVFGLLS